MKDISKMEISLDGLIGIMNELSDSYGGNHSEAARRVGVSESYWSAVIHKRCHPGPKILQGLGFAKKISYVGRKPPMNTWKILFIKT